MEAGLACPDWPLCFGTLFPGKQMNIQVFLEWFHRLDAFVVAVALLGQFVFSLIWRRSLPDWVPWAYGGLALLVAFQGALGALTVLNLLPSVVVITHLLVALTLVASLSGITQRLLSPGEIPSPLWWRFLGISSVVAVMIQSSLGSRMATSWASQRCINLGESCQLLEVHRFTAIPVTSLIFVFIVSSFFSGDWVKSQWPYLLSLFFLTTLQIFLGLTAVVMGLNEPLFVVGHQLVAALLVAFLSALSFKGLSPNDSKVIGLIDEPILETCHG